MSFLIVNSFHWIGYHIANYLLENGHEVDGFDTLSSSKEEHLSMYFARNDLFSLIASTELQSEYDTAIFIGNTEVPFCKHIHAQKKIKLHQGSADHHDKVINVEIPLLFGEWMHMNENGMFRANDVIPFSSETFLTEAIYIADFVPWLLKSVEVARWPQSCIIKSPNSKAADTEPEKTIYLRKCGPVDENLQKVKNHFNTFKHLYE